jgi:hypothetical protein
MIIAVPVRLPAERGVATMPEPDELTLAIARHLEVDWQYVERVEAWDVERIAEIRSAGRKAGPSDEIQERTARRQIKTLLCRWATLW